MMVMQASPRGVPLADLLIGLVDQRVSAEISVQGLSADSRAVRPGDLFLACPGSQTHGLEYLAQAIGQGAVAVAYDPEGYPVADSLAANVPVPAIEIAGLSRHLGVIADRFYAAPSRDMQVIGVTGTDGKTSVSHFIAQALSTDGEPAGLLGTLGYGVYGDLKPPTHTTPDALRLQEELATLRDHGVKRLAMEVSSHALDQFRCAGVHFHTAVLTQLSRDHLDYHGSLAAYADAKRRLFRVPGLQYAILNADDAFGRELAAELAGKVRIVSWQAGATTRPLADEWLALRALRALPQGMELVVDTSSGAATFETCLLGDFNAHNLLAALAALLASGLTLDDAVHRLSKVTTVPGRMEMFSAPDKARAVVDFAHTPAALEAALKALRPHCAGDLVCVFGAGGDRDAGKRPQMGAVAERYADRIIVTSDNPRHEDPKDIMAQILAGMAKPQRAEQIEDRGAAIRAALASAGKDDLVLIAGKGHEETQQLGDLKIAFSDRDFVARCLKGDGS